MIRNNELVQCVLFCYRAYVILISRQLCWSTVLSYCDCQDLIYFFQVFIYGESLRSTLVGIVVPDPETLVTWCSGKGIKGNYEDLLTNVKVNQLLLDDICAVGKEKGLKSFELVSAKKALILCKVLYFFKIIAHILAAKSMKVIKRKVVSKMSKACQKIVILLFFDHYQCCDITLLANNISTGTFFFSRFRLYIGLLLMTIAIN